MVSTSSHRVAEKIPATDVRGLDKLIEEANHSSLEDVSPVAGALKILTEIGAFHGDDAAHFVQAGAHAFPDAVGESFSACGIFGCATTAASCSVAFGKIRKICSDDGGTVVVVAGVENKADSVPDPFGGADRA